MGFLNQKDDVSDVEEVGFKVKCKRLLIKLLIMTVIGLIYAGIGFLIAYLIAKRNDYMLQDVTFSAGCLIVVIGLFMMMRGNPSGASLSSWGTRNSVAANYWLLDTVLQERKSTDYNKNFRKNAITEFTTNRFSFLLGGIFLAVFSVIFL